MKKTKKKTNIPKRGDEIYKFFFREQDSHPLTKHILPFFLQALGSSTTFRSYSRYIEICPLPFGYSSKHMESLCCILHHRHMSMLHCLSLIIFHAFVQGKFYLTWVDHFVVCLLNFTSRPSQESSQVQIQNWWSSLHDDQDPLVFPRRHVEYLRVVVLTLLLYSYLIFEYL